LDVIALPLDAMRGAATQAGGTVNDVYLAGILGGLREYHSKRGDRSPALRLGIPLSTRNAEESSPGGVDDIRNQFAPLVIRAPLQLSDPVERIRLVHELVMAARRLPLLSMLDDATGVVRRAPGAQHLIRRLLACVDLMASNVPGSPVDLYLGAAKVKQMIPWGPRSGAGLNVTLLSHAGTAHIGVNMDPVSITDPNVLLDCLRLGFDETLS
jgi:hypothetical protein